MIKFFLLLFALQVYANEAELLSSIEHQVNSAIEEEARLAGEKKEIETQIAQLQVKLKERRKLIAARLKAQNRLRNYRWGELLLNNNLNDLNRDLKILGNLNKYDLEIFKDYRQAIEMLAQARKNLSETEKQIQNNIAVLRKKQEDFKSLESVRIEILQRENSNSFLLQKGKISRPLDGKLIGNFGTVRDQVKQYFLLNFGELYVAPKASAVRSVGPGVVIFRDVLNQWRETLIVQHSDDYYSVYAGIKPDLRIKIGDKLEAGTIIGSTSRPEFYFELRHFANPIDPKPWYKEIK